MKVKPLQAVVLIVGAIAVVFLVWRLASGGGQVKLPHRVLMVDVTSGELFEANTANKSILEPAANPDTGVVALVRVRKDDETGEWYVGRRAMPLLDDLEVEPKAVDPETGKVLTPSPTVRRYPGY